MIFLQLCNFSIVPGGLNLIVSYNDLKRNGFAMERKSGYEHLYLLLRGVMPSGEKKVPMAQLRDVLIRAGFWNVRTYLQSGNRISRLWAFGT
jgi:hypothetical protein